MIYVSSFLREHLHWERVVGLVGEHAVVHQFVSMQGFHYSSCTRD